MSAFGWITTGHRLLVASFHRRRTTRKSTFRAARLGVESLENIDLLSHVIAHPVVKPAVHVEVAKPVVKPAVAHAITASKALTIDTGSLKTSVTPSVTTETTSTQTATVPSTLTNFTQTFTPAISLFNPALGTLVSVTVSASGSLTSNITAQNLSPTSSASITGFLNGSIAIDGIDQPITGNVSATTQTVTVPPFTGTTPPSVVFPPLTATTTAPTVTYTAASDLAFFTQSAGRTTISPTLAETAEAGANSPTGNTTYTVSTSGSGSITVSYQYIAVTPTVTKVVTYGIHHQPTKIGVTFGTPVDATDASNPAFYTVIVPNKNGSFTGPGTSTVAITSAVYDATTNTVLLTTAKHLNFHDRYELVVNLPASNGTPIVVEFGTKMSLAGFTNPYNHNAFVPVINGVPQYLKGPGPFPK